MDYDVVVLDIEGTTTSISFVHDVLFPYILRVLDDFLLQHWNDSQLQQLIQSLREQAQDDTAKAVRDANTIPPSSADSKDVIAAVSQSVRWQMQIDRKAGPLKALQGYIWRYGYQQGVLKGHVYEDVLPALTRWKEAGKQIYIYSSGSIEAQKLIFGHSERGDLLHFFSGHFDTGIGSKLEPSSYTKIASACKHSPCRIFFVSDNLHEIRAAAEAGFQVAITDRPGNAAIAIENDSQCLVGGRRVPVVQTFSSFANV
ncbi:acireductone synthase [Synchytrium endobioticum]|uniref:Acireductone synthase n=1 Tax=Synchytrium endobioticum TaxID=286115 RepID=A0A507D3R4_9FUNG|nr:acireductone synthase [Synchytrium endobioticum]